MTPLLVVVPPKKVALVAAFAALYLVWGSTYLGIRFAIDTIPPLLMAGTRFLLAGLIMQVIARGQEVAPASLAEWRTSLIVGACLLLGGNGGVTLAEQYVSSGLASVMVATVPIFIALLAWVMGTAPKPSLIVWLGLAGGFVGVAILLGPALHFKPNENNHAGIGMLILLCASFLWSAGSIYSIKAKSASSPFLAASQQMLCGGALLTLAGVVTGELHRFDASRVTLLSIGSFAYLVIVGAVVGFTAYIWLLRHCNPAKVATYAYVNPIVAVILGALFAGETLTARAMLAAGLIIGSVALVITLQPSKGKPMPVDAALAGVD
jgi:drug/metabolite transporter (DMT)-like permease